MITVSVVLLAIVGLVLFIGGQFYGQWKVAKKAAFMEQVFRKSFESYQEAMKHVIVARGMNYEALEQEALSWTINKTTSKLADHLKKISKAGGILITDDIKDAPSKDDKDSGSSGPSVH